MRRITGHLREKNGKWYAVVNHYDTEGKRKVRWHNLDLPVTKGNKKEAQHRLQRLLDQINTGDLYLMENMTPAERERHRLAESLVEDYLMEWCESHSKKVAATTAEQYRRYLELRVIPFFKELHVKMKEVTGDEINAFYETLVADGLKGTSQQRYHGVLHKAFKDAMKRRIIPSNPVEQADRPRSVPYIGEYYTATEIKKLLEVARNEDIYLVIALTAHYGLRRSEVLGLKWSAIDFEGDMIHVRHKVLGTPEGPVGYDVMKTVSSHRALGLSPAIKALLLEEREKQKERAKVLGNAYCRKDADYVCLNALGELFTPDYVSNRFATILRQNDLKHIRFHDLRHSCASLLVAQGVQMKLIQQWLGHSNISTTANIYSHVDAASTFQCAMTIDEVLGEGK